MIKKKKVLVTGGAGKIGAHFVRKHATAYAITVVDIQTSHLDFPANVQVIEADLTDYQTCKKLTKGMDVVIHLAGIIAHNLYGVAKCLGEALASYYADQHGISAICLRIGAYEFPEDHTEMNTRDLSAYLHPDDCNQLLVGCIETEGLHYEILNAISNNRYKRLDISESIEKVGYRPTADAFEFFKWKPT